MKEKQSWSSNNEKCTKHSTLLPHHTLLSYTSLHCSSHKLVLHKLSCFKRSRSKDIVVSNIAARFSEYCNFVLLPSFLVVTVSNQYFPGNYEELRTTHFLLHNIVWQNIVQHTLLFHNIVLGNIVLQNIV